MSAGNGRPRSREVTEGFRRAPARSMLRAVGFTDDDFEQAAGRRWRRSWNQVTPCNIHLDRLAVARQEACARAGAIPLIFTTITVSDGISMGHEGMRASLVRREAIADSVELVMHAERLDGLVTIAGCDKCLPGHADGLARLDLPSVFVYGGTILPGRLRGRDLTSRTSSRPSAPSPRGP